MTMLRIATVAALLVGVAAQAQVAGTPSVGPARVGTGAATGVNGSIAKPGASGDRARIGRTTLNASPNSTIIGTTTGNVSVTPPPIVGTSPAAIGTSVDGDGSAATPGTPGTAGAPPRS